MNDVTIHLCWYLEISYFFKKLTKLMPLFYPQLTQFCLWSDTYTAAFVKWTLPSILTFGCISLLWLKEFIQTPYFALYNVTLPSFLGVWSCQIFFFCGWFSVQGIEKDGWGEVRGKDVSELHSSSICQTDFWHHFLRASGCMKRVARLFLPKLLWRTDKLFVVYYAFENDETHLIPWINLEPVIYELAEYWISFHVICQTFRLNLC